MSAIEYSGAMSSVHGKDQLFQGLKFFLAAHIPQRSSYRDKIESHGGVVVRVENPDAYMVVDHLRKSQITQQDAISYRFVDDCIRSGSLKDADEFRVHAAATPRPAGDVSRRGRSAKVPFTREEDLFLWDTMTTYIEHGGSKQGRKSFEEIEQLRPRHTWQSWRERWIKQLMDKPRPVSLSKEHATNVGPVSVGGARTLDEPHTGPTATFSEVEPTSTGAEERTQDAANDSQTEAPLITAEEAFPNSSGELSAVVASDADKGRLMMLAGDILNLDPEQADAAWTGFAAIEENQHHSKERWMQIWNEVMLPMLGHMVQSWKENVETDQIAVQDEDVPGTGEASQDQGIVASADKWERSPAQANSKRRRETLQTSQSTMYQPDTPSSSTREKRREPMSSGVLVYQGASERESKRTRLADLATDANPEAAQAQNRNEQTQSRAAGVEHPVAGQPDSDKGEEDTEAGMEPDRVAGVETRNEQDASAPHPAQTRHVPDTAFIQEDDENDRNDRDEDEMEENEATESAAASSQSLGNSPRQRSSIPSLHQPAGTDNEREDAREEEQETATGAPDQTNMQIDDTEEASALFFDLDDTEEDHQQIDETIHGHEPFQTTNRPSKRPSRSPSPGPTPASEPDSSNIPTTIPGNTARSIPLSSGPSQRDLLPAPESSSSRSNYIRTTQPGFTSQLQMSSPGLDRAAAAVAAAAAEPGRKTSLIDSQERAYTSSVTPSSYDEDEEYEQIGVDEDASDEDAAVPALMAELREAAAEDEETQPTKSNRHDKIDGDESDDGGYDYDDNQNNENRHEPNKPKPKFKPNITDPPTSSPSSPSPSPSPSSSSDDQLETWFQQRLASGYTEKDVADALHASSLQLDLADEALIYLQQTGELPYGTRGIWTKGDDADLAVLSLRGKDEGQGDSSSAESDDSDDESPGSGSGSGSGSGGGNGTGKGGKRRREERERWKKKRKRRRERMEQRNSRLLGKHGEAYFAMRIEFLELEFP